MKTSLHQSRKEQFEALFPEAPRFRWKQIETALFDPRFRKFGEISALPQAMREKLDAEIPWLSLKAVAVLESTKKDTYKAVVALSDGKRVETVLMQNSRGHFSVCVSSQVGCAMACTFCATGKMGFTRNLRADEIVDQYRFWKIFLSERPGLSPYISNVVFMGMGEPLANYDQVKETLRLLLHESDMGPTRITVSTVGLLPMLEKILDDPEWPPVRLAISLHSADPETRKNIMPTSYDGFLDKLAVWTEKYFQKFESPPEGEARSVGGRRRHLTFEYVMLSRVNDTAKHAAALIDFARKIGKVRINLIPYNFTGSVYRDSLPGDFGQFEEKLRSAGVNVTKRRTMGEDIAAACGQLIVEKEGTTAA